MLGPTEPSTAPAEVSVVLYSYYTSTILYYANTNTNDNTNTHTTTHTNTHTNTNTNTDTNTNTILYYDILYYSAPAEVTVVLLQCSICIVQYSIV